MLLISWLPHHFSCIQGVFLKALSKPKGLIKSRSSLGGGGGRMKLSFPREIAGGNYFKITSINWIQEVKNAI